MIDVSKKRGGRVAEKSAAEEVSSAPPASGQKTVLFIALSVINMLVVAGVGFMIYQGRHKESAEPKIDNVIKAEHAAQEHEETEIDSFVGKIIPLETFMVNLSGSKGKKVAKVNMEIELDSPKLAEEIAKRNPQIRDYINMILSTKTYEEVSTQEGKNNLKNEIKDTLNSFLVQGKIKKIYFTEFIYN